MSLRTKLAVAFTAIYLGGMALVAICRVEELLSLSLNELGDFLAGAFGPLALAWLVFGYFQQGEELRQGTEALHLQAKELNASVLQQVEMVKAQQIALENHERSLEPFLDLEYQGTAEDVDGEFERFLLKNHGEYCDEINISYVRSDGGEFDRDVQPLHKGSERKFRLDVIYDTKTQLVVRYRKVSGKTGAQRFLLFREFDRDNFYSFVEKLS